MDRAAFAISQWRQEMPELDLRAMEVLGRLSELALVIRRDHLVPLFAEFGLQDGEFDVLAALRRSGAPFRMTPTELYGVTMLSSGGMTARLDRLEKSGLIERLPNPADRRGTLVQLSDKGRDLIERALPAHSANETRILAPLTDEEQKQFGRLMAKLLAGIQSGG